MSEQHNEFYDLANRVSRSVVAVIDTITQRGGFKGEELTTIGQLRDQCVHLIQQADEHQRIQDEEGE